MSNTFTSIVRQHWEKGIQMNLEKHLVAMVLANMKTIADGTVLNIPRLNFQSVGDYTKYTDLTIGSLTTANDTLTINKTKQVSFAIDKIDIGDNYINITPEAIKNGGYKLKQVIDGEFLAQYSAASNYYNASGMNNGAAAPVALVTGASQNISAVFGLSQAKLINDGADLTNLALVVDPFVLNTINTLGLETGFQVADKAFADKVQRGYQGTFLGMEVYLATNLSASVILDIATAPSDGDTVSVAGVTFTFKTALTPTAGEVLINTTADAASLNLERAINGTGTAGTDYVEISDSNRAKLKGFVSSTATAGSDINTITSIQGRMFPTSAMTNASNDFRAETIHCILMEKGAIWMAIRDNVTVDQRQEAKSLVDNYIVYTRYGIAVPQSGKDRMVDLQIEATAAQA